MKQTLIVPLRDVNSRRLVSLRVFLAKPNIISNNLGLHIKKKKKINYIFRIVFFQGGHKKLEPCPDRSPLGV